MSRDRTPRPAVSVPHCAAVDGKKLRANLYSQLLNPKLIKVTILAFNYNDFNLDTGVAVRNSTSSLSLISLLEKAASNGASITLITRDPFSESDHPPPSTLGLWLRGLRRLQAGGANVMLHPTLHAKVYLFELEGDRTFAAVGSSNLTHQGMGGYWVECNVRTFHPAEYVEIHRHVQQVIRDQKTEAIDTWERRIRRSPKGLLLTQV